MSGSGVWVVGRLAGTRREFAVVVVLGLAATAVVAAEPAGADLGLRREPGVVERSVPGRGLPAAVPVPDPEAATGVPRPEPVWPTAVRARVRPPAGRSVRVPGSNLSVGGVGAPAVDVETYGPAQVRALGGVGSAFRITPAADASPGPVRVSVDYSAFRYAAGGDFASRLRLRQVPACAVTTPRPPTCADHSVDVAASNDPTTGVLTATVPASAGTVFVLAAAASGDGGDYRATDLKPSGKWTVGTQSGDFTYSYPISMPPPPYGKAPDLALAYSAQSVDGRTSATNNQASWVGLGWDLNPGFIERKYRACADDGSNTLSDLCWHSPYSGDEEGAEYVISLGGTTTELLKDSTGRYHAKDDPGWRIEHKYDGSNSDNSSEAWVVSTSDGTRYFFGYHEDSTLTVPVVGDDAGEPCHSTSPSPCRQAYRWTLDETRDVNENSTRFTWTKETNYYKRFSSGSKESYDRGSYLANIAYGMHTGERAADTVDFNTGYRCASDIDKSTVNCAAPTSSSSGTEYPDVPVDLICTSGQDCTKNSPSFFTTRRLTSMVTNVWDPASSSYLQVNRIQPTFAFPNPEGEMGPMLWLNYLQTFGTWGENVTLPAVDFDGAYLRNRVDFPSGQATKAMPMRRITTVQNGLGGELRVHYGHGSAAATCPSDGTSSDWESGKHWDTNDQECFRVDYRPEGATSTTHGVFAKYVVTELDQVDLVGASPTQTTNYDYLGTPAWHYDDDLVVPADQQQWGDWRGYGEVRETIGKGPNEQRTVTETKHFRGMDGDKLKSGGTKSVSVTDWAGNTYPDNHAKAGETLQAQHFQLNADGSRTELASKRYTYWDSGVTADGPGLHNAHMIRLQSTYQRGRRPDGSWRETGSTDDGFTAANGGLATRRYDFGEVGVSTDNTCTEIRYAQNTADWRWMLNYPESEELHSGDPDAQSNECPGPVISRTVTLYDGATATGSANQPIDGNPTEVRRYWDDTHYAADKKSYDDYGRVITAADPLNHTTTTSYSPVSGWPINGVITTNALGQGTTTLTSRAFGVTTRTTDPNGLVTTQDFDGAGRLRRVWLPTEPKPTGPDVPPPAGAVPSYEYTYHVTLGGTAANSQPSKPTVVTSRQLQSLDGGTPVFLASYAYLDGFGRTREVQAPSPASTGGRTVTVTQYDDRGLTLGTSTPMYNSTAPGDDPDLLLNPAPSTIPSWTQKAYDALSRETTSTLYGGGQVVSTTRTANYGNGRIVTPDRGGRTAYWNDGHNRLAQVQENVAAGGDVPPPGTPTTSYSYDLRGELTGSTDAAGNVSSYGYDWLGRRISTKDPDAGTSTTSYDPVGNVLSTVDATGAALAYTYDPLNRKRTQWAGSVGGTKLAEWSYDTASLGAGQLATSTRYDNKQPYTVTVDSYDARHRPTGRTWDIPTTESALGGRYSYTYGYDRADHQTSVTYPATGDLPKETVTTAYTAGGVPDSLVGATTYVQSTDYTGSGKLAGRNYGPTGSVQRRYVFQPTGAQRLFSIQTLVGGNQVQMDSYDYDPVGNVTSITDQTQPAPQHQCFTYDALQRLDNAWTTAAACTAGPTAADTSGPDPYRLDYGYDAVGDLTSVVDNGATRLYTYPAPGPTAVRPHAATKVGGDSYGYDADGRLATRTVGGVAATLAWSPAGALASVTQPAGPTSFAYDADQTRLMRRDPDVGTLYLDGMELRLAAGTVHSTRYYTAGKAVVALRTATGVQWLGADQQNSTQVAVDATTGAVARQRYLPYGAHRGGDDIATTDRGFLGRVEDASTDLDQVGSRYYDPSTGRFISPDPQYDQDTPQSLNPYSYADGNPTTLSDPSGLRVCDGNGPGDFSCAPNQRPDGKDARPPTPCWGVECNGGPTDPPAPAKPRMGNDGLPIYHNDNGIGRLLFNFLFGTGGRDQYFTQYDPLTQALMASDTVRDWLHVIQVLLRAHGGASSGQFVHGDPKTNFFSDIAGALSHGLIGSNKAEAFLGSYLANWRTVPTGPHSAVAYITIRNKTDMNSLLHPEFTLSRPATWAGGGRVPIRINSIDPPWRSAPGGDMTQQFDFQVPINFY